MKIVLPPDLKNALKKLIFEQIDKSKLFEESDIELVYVWIKITGDSMIELESG